MKKWSDYLMFCNIPKDLIPKEDLKDNSEFWDLVDSEKNKCKKGFKFNGISFPKTLYWFINHVKIPVEGFDEYGGVTMVPRLPMLRDTDWFMHSSYEEANLERMGLLLGSCRQAGKTKFLLTICTHEINFTDGAEILMLFSIGEDKDTFVKDLRVMLQNNTDFLQIPNIDQDLNKKNIRFGFKEEDNTDRVEANLFLYLTEEGNATEKPAGKTLSMFGIDEVAKNAWLSVQEAVLPAIRINIPGERGLKAKMFCTFTGGNAEKFGDAKKAFNSPETWMFKAFGEDKTGFFLPAEFSQRFKKKSTLGEFLIQEYGKKFEVEELDNFPMWVTDWELAKKVLDEEEELAKLGGIQAINKRKMYDPRKKEDMFLSGEDNMFGHLSSELQKVKEYINNNIVPTYKKVEFKRNKNTNEVTVIPSNKPIILSFPPPKEHYEQDTAIVILKEPQRVDRGKLYVMGADLINVDSTSSSTSLGGFAIYQRATPDFNNPFNDTCVAFYNGRKDIKDLSEKLLCTLLYYGAEEGNITLLHEAANDTLTQQFSEIYKGHFLEDTYSLSRDINRNTKTTNSKGLRPTVKNQTYLLERFLEYMEEEMEDGRLGLWRLKDPYLVDQILSFDGDLAPMDAIVANIHTVGHLFKERKYFVPNLTENLEKKENKTPYRRKTFSNNNYRRKRF